MHPHLSTAAEALAWLEDNGIRRVELVFADLTSVARGKILSTASFVETLGAKMPSLLLGLTVTGGEPKAVFERIFPQGQDICCHTDDYISLSGGFRQPADSFCRFRMCGVQSGEKAQAFLGRRNQSVQKTLQAMSIAELRRKSVCGVFVPA